MGLFRCYVTAFMQLLGLALDNNNKVNGIHHGPQGRKNNEDAGESLKGREEGIPQNIQVCNMNEYPGGFQMPVHYPRYNKQDYESMEVWRLDMILKEYGLSFKGALHEKRSFAVGLFLWPDHM